MIEIALIAVTLVVMVVAHYAIRYGQASGYSDEDEYSAYDKSEPLRDHRGAGDTRH